LFLSEEYQNYKPWTQDGWNRFPEAKRKEFSQKMYDIYYDVRHGIRVSNSLVENARKILIRKQNLDLESTNENRTQRKLRLQREFQDHQDNLPEDNPDKFSPEQIAKIIKIQTQGGSAKTYKNLRDAILQGKNIEYETVGSNHAALKNLFEIIIESTKHCQYKYTYIVLGVLNLCSIQESFNRQLCRFFRDSSWFVDSLEMGNSWNDTHAAADISWGIMNPEQKNLIDQTPGPKLSISTTSQKINNDLYTNMVRLIETCNKGTLSQTNPPRQIPHKGSCVGFGIDILLVTYIPPPSESINNLIATLPLSTRSQYLIKSTSSGNPISNYKWDFKLVIDILNRLQTGVYGRSPMFDIHINCDVDDNARDIHTIIRILLDKSMNSTKNKKTKAAQFYNNSSIGRWKRSMHAGKRRKKTRRKKKKTRKARKKKRKSRKRTRASVERLKGFLQNFSKYDGNISKLKEIYK